MRDFFYTILDCKDLAYCMSAWAETLPNFDYDTSEDVYGNRKFDSSLQEWCLNDFFMLIVEGPYHSPALFKQAPLAAARCRCIYFLLTSCNFKFSLWSYEEIILNFSVYQKKISSSCLSYPGNFLLTQLEIKKYYVCNDLQLSAIVLYTCSTLCVVASGLKIPRG